MRRLKKTRGGIEEPQMNLTPLIDVVFVILIMFIVLAPLLELDQVQLAEGGPGLKTVSVQESSELAIHVLADNTIRFNKQLVNIYQLEEFLKLTKAKNPNLKPQLFHDKRALFGTYQGVKNALERAGYSQVDVILSPA